MSFISASHLGPPPSASFDLLRIDQGGDTVGFAWVERLSAGSGELGRHAHTFVTGPDYDPDPKGSARSFHQIAGVPGHGTIASKAAFIAAMQEVYPQGAHTWHGISITHDHWPWQGEPRELDRGSVGILAHPGTGPERGFVFTELDLEIGGTTFDRVEFWGSHTTQIGPHLPNLLHLAPTSAGTGQTLEEFQEFLLDWMDTRDGPYRYEVVRLMVTEGVTASP